MNELPLYVSIVFVLTTILTVFFFYKACHFSKVTLIILVLWLVLQGIISVTGFYTVTNTFPPRFLLVILPPLFFIVFLFATKKGRSYLNGLDIKMLTLLHLVRIPVEVVLLWLFIYKTVPQLMTFEGSNFDILSGISAPFIYYFGFIKQNLGRRFLICWHFICLGLLLNIVILAILSAPFPFQQLALDQPNIAIAYFPFIWLPGCIVPLVLLSHLAALRHLFYINRK